MKIVIDEEERLELLELLGLLGLWGCSVIWGGLELERSGLFGSVMELLEFTGAQGIKNLNL